MDKVIFVNYFHNGDIHLSRSFVKYMVNIFTNNGIECLYCHRNDPGLLVDIPNLKHTNQCNLSENTLSAMVGNNLYLSTWYGAGSRLFLNKYGISYNCLYHVFEDHIKKYLSENDFNNFANQNKSSFFPDIDYSFFNVSGINNWILRDQRKKVLFCNGDVLSGQSENINLDHVLDVISSEFSDICFIPTNRTSINKHNVIPSWDIIGKTKGSDLNETSYLSTFCDIIFGRDSGAYTFGCTKYNNLIRNTLFISFSNLESNSWCVDNDFSLTYSSKTIHSNRTTDIRFMLDTLRSNIRENLK